MTCRKCFKNYLIEHSPLFVLATQKYSSVLSLLFLSLFTSGYIILFQWSYYIIIGVLLIFFIFLNISILTSLPEVIDINNKEIQLQDF